MLSIETDFLNVIRTRRVTRIFTGSSIPRERIELVLESARWAPNGGKRRLNVYIVVQDSKMIRRLRAVSPGIFSQPGAIVVVGMDTAKAHRLGYRYREHASGYVDLGTALENMLLTAHVLGLGACPCLSFHKRAVQLLLDLPETVSPEMLVLLGEPARPRKVKSLSVDVDLFVHWGRYGGTEDQHR